MKCPRCGYGWESKIPNPKECPRCKGRLDYTPGPVGAPKIGKKGGEKVMTSKLTWATAMIIIVAVAGVGAWAVLGTPGAPAGTATVEAIAGQGTVFAGGVPSGTTSGIENVYIITHGAVNENDNLSGSGSLLGTITTSGGSCTIAYETAFDIVVAVKVGTDNMAYVSIDNMNVGLQISGSFTLAEENAGGTTNSSMAVHSHENSGYGTTSGWLRINAVWDNNGVGYDLPAGGSITLSNIKLWGWK